MVSRSTSFWVVLFPWAAIAVTSVSQDKGYLFSWDAFGYHLHLPATFVQHDPLIRDRAWVDEAHKRYRLTNALYQLTEFDEGARVIRYPMGQAVLWTPWFLIGHGVALTTDHLADGYSAPYQWSVRIGVLLYFLFGLLALRAVLLRSFSEGIVALSMALLMMGTNILDQAISAPSMPHIVLFSLYAGILYYTMRWGNDARWRYAVPLGALMGFATLVRPTEAVCLLIPLFWYAGTGPANPFSRAWHLRKQWVAMLGIMFLIGLPQFVYWKLATGHWIIDPYNNPGEGLDMLAPHTGPFLFGLRKGWYVYTPLMLVATMGILLLRQQCKEAYRSVLVFFVVNLWVVSSWTCWWYAGSFGSRAMVGSYALMALPLAALLTEVRSWQPVLKWSMGLLLSSVVVLNLFQHWQYGEGIIHPSRMTLESYRAVFGKTQAPDEYGRLLLVDRDKPFDPEEIGLHEYRKVEQPEARTMRVPTDRDTVLVDEVSGDERVAFVSGVGAEFTPALRIPYLKMTDADHLRIELTWHVLVPSQPIRGGFVHQMDRKGANYGYKLVGIEHIELKSGEWNEVTTHYLTPEIRNDRDVFQAYYWSLDTIPVLVDGPYITIREPVRRY